MVYDGMRFLDWIGLDYIGFLSGLFSFRCIYLELFCATGTVW